MRDWAKAILIGLAIVFAPLLVFAGTVTVNGNQYMGALTVTSLTSSGSALIKPGYLQVQGAATYTGTAPNNGDVDLNDGAGGDAPMVILRYANGLNMAIDATSGGIRFIREGREGAAAVAASISPTGSFLSQIASGSNAYSVQNNGARFAIGGGSTYLSSDGTTITAASPVAVSGAVTIGSGGTAISKSLANTSTIDVANIAANTCVDTAITLTGATAGTICAVGAPASPATGVVFNCYVSATNTVQLHGCCIKGTDCDPASADYQVRVLHP